MCCQPPKVQDDLDELFEENMLRIKSAPKELPCIGITGGEPTLLGERLVLLIKAIREHLPQTEIHILSNGRNFSDMEYAKRIAEAGGEMLLVGIPLHSDYEHDHDVIAGTKGAYVETIKGIYNLAMNGVAIELRIVMNRLNYSRFPQIAEFIHKNLSFVTWTAFMGMERTGFANSNNKIWIEPKEYSDSLSKAVKFLDGWQHEVYIYNIPLCLLPDSVHAFAAKSISDWKNIYQPICELCCVKDKCCGCFATSSQPYEGLSPILKTI